MGADVFLIYVLLLIGSGIAMLVMAGVQSGQPAGRKVSSAVFGTLTFTHCLIDGGPVAVSLPYRYQRVNSSNTVPVATGALSSAGTNFATFYGHS